MQSILNNNLRPLQVESLPMRKVIKCCLKLKFQLLEYVNPLGTKLGTIFLWIIFTSR